MLSSQRREEEQNTVEGKKVEMERSTKLLIERIYVMVQG